MYFSILFVQRYNDIFIILINSFLQTVFESVKGLLVGFEECSQMLHLFRFHLTWFFYSPYVVPEIITVLGFICLIDGVFFNLLYNYLIHWFWSFGHRFVISFKLLNITIINNSGTLLFESVNHLKSHWEILLHRWWLLVNLWFGKFLIFFHIYNSIVIYYV